MRCEQADEMLTARLDGRLSDDEEAALSAHLAECDRCRAEWRRLEALNALLAAAPTLPAPAALSTRVLARLERREQVRRLLVGGLALVLGTVSLAALALAPVLTDLLNAVGLLTLLLTGGLTTLGHLLAVLLVRFAVPLVALFTVSLLLALALNGLWLGAVRRIRV